MGSQPYGPMTDFINKYRSLPGRALNAVSHPLTLVESLLGISQPKPAQPAPDPYMLHNDPDIAAANQSYRDAANATPPPARAAARKKYPGMMSGQ